jgi:asparagine synthase (glutamine-hydrolysing)
VRTIRRLQRVVALEHISAPVSADGAVAVDSIRELHALSDGEVNAIEYAPLLQAWPTAHGRWNVSLSGSGGEIARGYYYAAIKQGTVDVSTLVHKLSGASRPALGVLARDRFPDPLAPLRAEVERFLAAAHQGTPELAMEDLYIRGRMQRFAGRNISTTGYFFRQALPFFERDVIAASLGLPPERKAGGGAVVRDAVAAWVPPFGRIPLDTGIALAPRTWRQPTTQARWAVAMGRKALVRYGGTAGTRIARPAPPPVPWSAYRASPAFQTFIRETLPARGAHVHELVDPAAANALVEAGLAGGNLYPVGQLLTLELTMSRLRGSATG